MSRVAQSPLSYFLWQMKKIRSQGKQKSFYIVKMVWFEGSSWLITGELPELMAIMFCPPRHGPDMSRKLCEGFQGAPFITCVTMKLLNNGPYMAEKNNGWEPCNLSFNSQSYLACSLFCCCLLAKSCVILRPHEL